LKSIKQTSALKSIVPRYVRSENATVPKIKRGELQVLNTKMQQQIEWRRDKVLELSSQGHSQTDIADTLHVNKPVINRDMAYLKQQAQENLKTHIQDKLPEEYQNCMTGINQVLKICCEIVNKSKNVNNDNDQTVTITDNKTILQ
jgi:predicted transcriptional regulator